MSDFFPTKDEIDIRPARVEEADALSALAMRSKAYWGYDAAFMMQCVEALTVNAAEIEAGRVIVAEGPDGVLGMMGWEPLENDQPDDSGEQADWDVSYLFVEPAAMGLGIGRVLFENGIERIRRAGGGILSILADPGARPFYEKVGAELIGDAPSDAIPGRRLPLLRYRI